MWTKIQIGVSIVLFLLMSVANCTFGPYFPLGGQYISTLQACPAGGFSKIRCRPEVIFNDCRVGFECIRRIKLFKFDKNFCGVCCPALRKCPKGSLHGPLCNYGKKCSSGFWCRKGVCCQRRISVCPTGSVPGRMCSLLFPCKPGNLCVNGLCCSIPKLWPVCPSNYFLLPGVNCGLHSRCPGHAVCFKNKCCYPEKLAQGPDLLQPKFPPKSPLTIGTKKPPSRPSPSYPQSILQPANPASTNPPIVDVRKIQPTRPSPKYPPSFPPKIIKIPPETTNPLPGTRRPVIKTQKTSPTEIAPPHVLVRSCPRGLRQLPGVTCDHILGCPGNSQCLSGLCCIHQHIYRHHCPANHRPIHHINCELRQPCPGDSVCVSGLCCQPITLQVPHCPESHTLVTSQSCDMNTCTGSNICISGLCCRKSSGTQPPVCPLGYRLVIDRICDSSIVCPIDNLCFQNHCCELVLGLTKPTITSPLSSSVYSTPGPVTIPPGITSVDGSTPSVAPRCPPGNISIPGLSCDQTYMCPAGSQCISGICCLSFNTVKVPACPVDFLSTVPCPDPRYTDQCSIDVDCGPFMICCLTSCDRRVCKPIISPKHSKPRK